MFSSGIHRQNKYHMQPVLIKKVYSSEVIKVIYLSFYKRGLHNTIKVFSSITLHKPESNIVIYIMNTSRISRNICLHISGFVCCVFNYVKAQ